MAQGQAPQLKRLKQVLARFDVHIADADDLAVLRDYEIVVIADDSGSMGSCAAPPHLRTLTGPNPSRWDELKASLGEIVAVATCFDESGVDIFFLNRPAVMGVKSADDPSLLQALAGPPQGRTPLTETLTSVVDKTVGERPVLLLIFTDGEPNGGSRKFSAALRRIVTGGAAGRVRVQIMACTAEQSEIAWLNALDAELPELDVTDDYYSERAEVLRVGLATKFTRGDWCMKALLGPVSQKFDAWDERTRREAVDVACDACCVM
eukprot:CAMPEP_0170261040 /NCGR_PEP_ID=MMETSP0116_2-20130129/30400_1 /TAXON_ID=400756 /ORGANISM="Durinskia baltica, Strain CSIRO CS-38" /LENGTH=263 /DNA_ID=CAMNT_0010512103 /DNA_START=12 /DNA_END=803 /DNA_ORIENTATION=-